MANNSTPLNPSTPRSRPGFVPGSSTNTHASKLAQARSHVPTVHEGVQEFTVRVLSVSPTASPWYSIFLSTTTQAYTVKVDLRALYPQLLDPDDLPPGIKNVEGIKKMAPGEFSGISDVQPEAGDHVVVSLYDRNNPTLGGRVVEVIKSGVAGSSVDSTTGKNRKTSKGAFTDPCEKTKPKPNVASWSLERTAAAMGEASDVATDILTTAAQFWGITSASPKKTPSSYTETRPKTTTVAAASAPQPGQVAPTRPLESPTPMPSLSVPGCGPKYTISESSKRSLSSEQLCKKAGIPCPVMAAIRHVESRGRPGVLRFEPNKFRARRPDLRDRIPYTRNPAKGFSTTASETGKMAFAHAFELDPAIAIKSTSFGSYQVMGWALLRSYGGDAQKAWDGFRNNPAEASDLMLIEWMKDNPRAQRAANSSPPNFAALAKIYNGPNYRVNKYDTKMHNFWRKNR
jgi:hypothetical protein